ncbi:metalloregulator ArsR/SmtB family transcription factor [Mesorhizobium sp. BR1-1-16]|uniref:ArsR/SmtB family transcription factor n=1 Tax=Mesorhizobium sp. BR1-1-16 TaxID=2876653 RepID=UPI001CCA3606|nr:metalloregulator ArsR/SmtB family transcription factor [Mesorhizobium sp. BR1-1-16]MBZ9936463.1 metalloregulator ArsR/SmtB family transcription factor [Mesorhizobium sp. BR1-1-16]
MDEPRALDAFAALSQETRLKMVRVLVQAGTDGMAAGAIGDAVEASSSSASFHLAHLERAGLVRSRRESRSIIYSADYAALSGLAEFLMRDCCQGHPAICTPAPQTRQTATGSPRRDL